jgi:hypothetical protein
MWFRRDRKRPFCMSEVVWRKDGQAMTCFDLKDAFQHRDVNIGWFPFRARRDTEIRTIPGGGNVKAEVLAGRGVGVQSVRNPDRRSVIARRKAERAGDGSQWVWCYRRQGAPTGWIAFDDLEPDPGRPTPLIGPAKLDFEVGRTAPGVHAVSGCGRDIRDRPRSDRTRDVIADDVYLRYSPRGTAKHYLHHGDEVLLLLVEGPHRFAFVEVLASDPGNPAKPGTRGWILAEKLKARP